MTVIINSFKNEALIKILNENLVGKRDELTRSDICYLEKTTKDDLLLYVSENYDLMLSTSIIFAETSGTTGVPLPTPRNCYDFSWNVNNLCRAYKKYLNPGTDRVAILHPSIMSPFVEASARALQELQIGYLRVFPIPSLCDYLKIHDILTRYKITSIMSTPTLVYKLIFELHKAGEKIPASVEKILVTGEKFTLSNAKNMKKALIENAIIVPFVYGSSESATLMIGNEDFTFSPINDDFLLEIECEENKTETTKGNLLVTWLNPGFHKVVRYDTKDVFEAKKINDSYRLNYISREVDKDVDIDELCKIEDVIYLYPRIIFNVSILFFKILDKYHVHVDGDFEDRKDFVNYFKDNLGETFFRIDELIINSNDSVFRNENIKPKTQSFSVK